MKSFREILDAFGIPEFAALVGVEESHVRVMKARDSIPPKYWRPLLEAKKPTSLQKLTLAVLDDLYVARFSKTAAE